MTQKKSFQMKSSRLRLNSNMHVWTLGFVQVWFPYGSLLSGAVFANVPSQQKSSKALPPLCLLYKIKIIMMYDSENGWRSLITLRGSKNPEDPLIAL